MCSRLLPRSLSTMGGIEFVKGHGTQNDFVLLPDPSDRLNLTPERIAKLCDRQRGLGADGVLRVVPPAAVGADSNAAWFMDYYNADGSHAEMCGNGMRVFARYLVDAGLERGPEFVVGSRIGDQTIRVHEDGWITVHLPKATVTGTSVATLGECELSGMSVDVGNPHLVSIIDEDVSTMDLNQQPRFDQDAFPNGVNLEIVNIVDEDTLRMRVHERGVGETRSCGTGTVAAVTAMLHTTGTDTGTSTVELPGGKVLVTIRPDASMLTGPAVLVAQGMINEAWWQER